MPFLTRWAVSAPSPHGRSLRHPRAFPRLRWQLFLNRLEKARTRRAQKACVGIAAVTAWARLGE